MYAEDFGGYDGGNGKTVENIDKGFPCFDVTSPLALIIEAIH